MVQPLAGRRVLVTRAAHQSGKLSEGLRALGAEPVEVPVLEISPPLDCASLDKALLSLAGSYSNPGSSTLKPVYSTQDPGCLILSAFSAERVGDHDRQPAPVYDWLILTSANTVRAIMERAAALGISFREQHLPLIAAIGEATSAAAREAGFSVALVPQTYVAESLVQGMATMVSRKRILLVRAAIARDVIPDALRDAGATVDVVDAYRNVLPESAPALLREALQAGIGAATFTSSSSVTHLAEAARAAGVDFPFPGVPAVSIGPVTSATLREFGWQPAAEASPSDISGLIAAIELALR